MSIHSRPLPRTSRASLRGLTVGVAVLGLIGFGVVVVPQAGASGVTPAATTTTCRGVDCPGSTLFDFEDGALTGWEPLGGASLAVSGERAAVGSKSMVIDGASIGAGARVTVTSSLKYTMIGLQATAEPAATTSTTPGRTWIMLTITHADRAPFSYVEEIGTGEWTYVNPGVTDSPATFTLDVTVVQQCGTAIGRRVFIDDVEFFPPPTGAILAGPDAPKAVSTAGMRSSAGAAAKTTKTTKTGRTTSTTTDKPVCVGSTTTPAKTTTTVPTTPTTPTTTLFSFENGKRDGWKPDAGVTAKITIDSSPAEGARVLDLKATTATAVGLRWTGSTKAFTGTGTWYHVAMPVRASWTTFTTSTSSTTSATGPQVQLTVSGPVDEVRGDRVAVAQRTWTTVDLWFTLDATAAAKKAAKVTISLVPAPQMRCGPTLPPPTALAVDAITFSRTAELSSTVRAAATTKC